MDEISQLQQKIIGLKKRLGAVIVAHNYQRPEVQDMADFVGDSLELARRSSQVEAETIVFCGVHFMAETAAILNPGRTVLLSVEKAGCPLADMITADELKRWKEKYPEAKVVTYVNSSAAVKAESFICCTSANGVKVVESVPGDNILFIPDYNLGHYISGQTKKKIILYPGFCIVHNRITAEQVEKARELHPEAQLVVHPECRPEVIDLADAVLSTSGMLRYVKASPNKSFIIGTEEGLLHRLRKENPEKSFYLVNRIQACVNMKRTTLKTVVENMEQAKRVVRVPEDMRIRAKEAVDRMLEVN